MREPGHQLRDQLCPHIGRGSFDHKAVKRCMHSPRVTAEQLQRGKGALDRVDGAPARPHRQPIVLDRAREKAGSALIGCGKAGKNVIRRQRRRRKAHVPHPLRDVVQRGHRRVTTSGNPLEQHTKLLQDRLAGPFVSFIVKRKCNAGGISGPVLEARGK